MLLLSKCSHCTHSVAPSAVCLPGAAAVLLRREQSQRWRYSPESEFSQNNVFFFSLRFGGIQKKKARVETCSNLAFSTADSSSPYQPCIYQCTLGLMGVGMQLCLCRQCSMVCVCVCAVTLWSLSPCVHGSTEFVHFCTGCSAGLGELVI